jgi:hypothetical protein
LRQFFPAIRAFAATDSLGALGIDSITLARFSNVIQTRFGVTLPLPVLSKLPSLLHVQLAIFGGGDNFGFLLEEKFKYACFSSSLMSSFLIFVHIYLYFIYFHV